MLVCLWFLCKITWFFQVAGIHLTIQHSSKYLFDFLIIHPDFVLTDGAAIFEGMSVLGVVTVPCDIVLLGSMIFS